MSLEVVFEPFEEIDARVTELFDGAPLLVALGLAFVLGLRHAADPDHLLAVTALVVAKAGDTKAAIRLGTWWGVGHGAVLLALGLPLLAFKSEMPPVLGQIAEKGIGLVIVVLAIRVTWKWIRGDYLADRHVHAQGFDLAAENHRHLRGTDSGAHRHLQVRSPGQAFAIGALHGLAGTGAMVVLLLAALPNPIESAAALAIFAPMSILSMAGLTGAFTWILTRRLVEPVYKEILIPVLGIGHHALWLAPLKASPKARQAPRALSNGSSRSVELSELSSYSASRAMRCGVGTSRLRYPSESGARSVRSQPRFLRTMTAGRPTASTFGVRTRSRGPNFTRPAIRPKVEQDLVAKIQLRPLDRRNSEAQLSSLLSPQPQLLTAAPADESGANPRRARVGVVA